MSTDKNAVKKVIIAKLHNPGSPIVELTMIVISDQTTVLKLVNPG